MLIWLHQCMWIFGGLCFTVAAGQEMVGNTECKDSDICFTIHKASPGFTRAEADTYCRDIGRSLAVIPDEHTQDVISRLAWRGTGTDQLAWVGGLRGRDTKWKDPDGDFVRNLDRLVDSNAPSPWCSGVKLDTFGENNKVFPLDCSSTFGYRAVCERGMSCKTDTSAGKFDISGVCHVVSDVTFTSWMAAQVHCEINHTRGNLAFSVIDRGSRFTGTYDSSEGYIWTGFQRRSWVWKTSTVSEALVTYTNWLPSEPGASDTGECLVVDLTQNGGWRVSDCAVTRGYFICQSPPLNTTTTIWNSSIEMTPTVSTYSTSSEVTSPPSTSHSETTTGNITDPDEPTENCSPTPAGSLNGGALGGSIGGILLVAVVIITTLLIRRKFKHTARGNSNLNSLEKNDVTDTKDGSKTDTSFEEPPNVPLSENRRYDTLDVPKKNRAHLTTHPSRKHPDSMPLSSVQSSGNGEYITTQVPPSDTNNYENEGSTELEPRAGVVYEEVILETSEMIHEADEGLRLEDMEANTNAAHVNETKDGLISDDDRPRNMSQQAAFENTEPQYLSPKRAVEDAGSRHMSQQSAVTNVKHRDMSHKTTFQNAEQQYLSPQRAVVDTSQQTAVKNVLPCTTRPSRAAGIVGPLKTSRTRTIENAGLRNMDQRSAIENEYVDDCSAPYIIVDVENDGSVRVHNDYEEVVIVEDSSQW